MKRNFLFDLAIMLPAGGICHYTATSQATSSSNEKRKVKYYQSDLCLTALIHIQFLILQSIAKITIIYNDTTRTQC